MFKEYGTLSTMLYEHKNPAGHSVGGDIEFYSNKLKGISSLLVGQGMSMKAIQLWLGHSTFSTTADIYECVK